MFDHYDYPKRPTQSRKGRTRVTGVNTDSSMKPAPVRRIGRAFAALEFIVEAGRGVTLTELAAGLKLSPSSAHDLLKSMEHARVVEFQPPRNYTLGSRVISLAAAIIDAVDVGDVAYGPMKELSEATEEDVYLAVLAGNSVVYIRKHEGPAPLRVNIGLGQPRPLHASSVGKLFAAYSDKLRTHLLGGRDPLTRYTARTITDRRELSRQLELFRGLGMSVTDEEAIVGVVGFAVPVFDSHGDISAGLHVSLPRARLADDHVTLIISEMFRTARKTSVATGGTSPDMPIDLTERILRRLQEASTKQ